MSFYVIDVESDGQILGRNSLVCFGAVRLDNELQTTFYGKTRPISEEYDGEALAVSGFSRSEHESFDDPKLVFERFGEWIEETNLKGRPILIADNNGYDASWINWYFLTYSGTNPFGIVPVALVICGAVLRTTQRCNGNGCAVRNLQTKTDVCIPVFHILIIRLKML